MLPRFDANKCAIPKGILNLTFVQARGFTESPKIDKLLYPDGNKQFSYDQKEKIPADHRTWLQNWNANPGTRIALIVLSAAIGGFSVVTYFPGMNQKELSYK